MNTKINLLSILGGLVIAAAIWTTPAQSADIEVFVNQLCSNIAEDSGTQDAITPCVFIIDAETQNDENSAGHNGEDNIADAIEDCEQGGNGKDGLFNKDAGEQKIGEGFLPTKWSKDCYSSASTMTTECQDKTEEIRDPITNEVIQEAGECLYWIQSGNDSDAGMYKLPDYDSADEECGGDPCVELEGGKTKYIPWLQRFLLGTGSVDDYKKVHDARVIRNADIEEIAPFETCMALFQKSDASVNDGDISFDGDYWGYLWFSIYEYGDYGSGSDFYQLRIVVKEAQDPEDWIGAIAQDLATPPAAEDPAEGGLALLEVPALVSSPAVSVDQDNRLFHDEHVYISMFRPDQTLGWLGNVKKYKFCQDTSSGCTLGELLDVNDVSAVGTDNRFKDSSKSYWSSVVDGPTVNKGGAGEKVPVHTSRTVYTYTGPYTDSGNSPASPVTLTSYDPGDPSGVTTAHLDITNPPVADPTARRVEVMNFMLGKDEKDEDNDTLTNEERPWKFPSPLHSRPKVLVIPNPNGEDWVKILVGSHHGMLHLINASTGVEEWAFAAPTFLVDHENIYDIAGGDKDSLWGEGIAHVYGLDGNPQVLAEDTSNPADGVPDKWTVIIGCRRGCDTLYALELTADGSGNLTPKFKWRILGGTSPGFTNLGETWSDPLPIVILRNVSSTLTPTYALAMGAGYDVAHDSVYTATDKANGVYLVNPSDGSKLLSIGNKGSGADVELAGMHCPIPGAITPVDSNADKYIDRLYFADLCGQVWRVDLNTTLASSTGGVLARLGDYTGDDNSDNPIMAGTVANERRMYYAPEVSPIYDQEGISKISQYDVITLTSGWRAHPLDKVIQDRIYAIRDYQKGTIAVDGTTKKATNYPQCGGGSNLATCSGPIAEANLYNATDNLIQEGSDGEKTAAREVLQAKEGWYIVLENPASGQDPELLGEKGLSKTTVIAGKLIVTTYIPPQTCDAWTEQGSSRLYALELLTGEAIFADFDGDPNTLGKTDRYFNIGKGLPSQALPVFQQGGVTLIVSTGGGSNTDDPGVAIPVATTFWFER